MSLTETQLETLKDFILAEKERVLNSMNDVSEEKVSLKVNGSADEVDQASDEYQRAQMLRFRKRNLFYAKKLNGALEKFNHNEYGTCEECDATIKFERLKARPTAELCITCKDEAEKEEQGNFLASQSKSLVKKIDITTSRSL